MANVAKLRGVNNLIKRLSLEGKKGRVKLRIGMKRAGAFILRESQLRVPVDLGNLKGSGFVRFTGSAEKPSVTIGYTAAYAIYVHENLEAKHGDDFNLEYSEQIATAKPSKDPKRKGKKYFRLRGENQTSKFLEKAVRENVRQIFNIIKRAAKA